MAISTSPATTVSVANDQQCQSVWDPGCGLMWWDVVGPMIIFLIILLILVVICQCFVTSCNKCCECCSTRRRRRRRRRNRGNRVSTVSEGVSNNSYANENPDLPPSYSPNGFTGELFRVATIEDLSATEKLPTYEEIIKQREEDENSRSKFHSTIFIEDETINPSTSSEQRQGSSRRESSDADREDAVEDDVPDPPSYRPDA